MSLNRLARAKTSFSQGLLGLAMLVPVVCLGISGCGESQQFVPISSKSNSGGRPTQNVSVNQKNSRQSNSKKTVQPVTVTRHLGK
ncbi:MAG: hypothetical protein ACKO5E_21765 [bacterium]